MIASPTIGRRALVGAGLAALGAAAAGTMRNLVIRTRASVTVTERGATLAGLRAALLEAGQGGGTVRLAARTIRIDAAELIARGSIPLPASVALEGEGTSIVVEGPAVPPPLFVARDTSAIALRNLSATGNGRAIADTRSGTFALFELSAAAGGDMEDIRLENVDLSRFAGERWVQFLQRAPDRTMAGLRLDDVRADGGGSVAPGRIGVSAAAIWVHGAAGEIRDVAVRRLTVDAAGLKQGCALFHKVRGAMIETATVTDAGLRGAADDAGAYAIMAYADPGEMSDIAILSPTIRSPRSAGIYLRGVQRARVTGAGIDGQTDRVATNLPKGAIALNACSGVVIEGGRLTGNAIDLSVADGGVNGLDLDVNGLETSGSRTSVFLAISPGTGPVVGARFSGCTLSGRDRVFQVMNEQVVGRHYDQVWLHGGTFRSDTAANVIELNAGAITAATGYRIESVTVQANNVGIMAAGIQGTVTVHQTTIEGLGRLNYGLIVDDCPRIDLEGLTFRGMPSGYAYAARSGRRRTAGTIRNLRFDKVVYAAARGSLTVTP